MILSGLAAVRDRILDYMHHKSGNSCEARFSEGWRSRKTWHTLEIQPLRHLDIFQFLAYKPCHFCTVAAPVSGLRYSLLPAAQLKNKLTFPTGWETQATTKPRSRHWTELSVAELTLLYCLPCSLPPTHLFVPSYHFTFKTVSSLGQGLIYCVFVQHLVQWSPIWLWCLGVSTTCIR